MENFQSYLVKILAVSSEDVENCEQFYSKKKVEKGEFLLREGEACNDTFYVEKGLLRMFSIDKNGKEHIIQFAPESWIIADRTSQIFREESHYYIDAVEESEIAILPPDFFFNIFKNNPEVSGNNYKLMSNHIRSLQKRINQLLGATAEERYLDFLKMYPNVFQRVPQWMVASYLGITPESLSRVRKELTKKKS
ncbi:Crp/Fnr family transcriptional regulator [Halpernia sp.]|uniref:Crp/Fnr family transcriptional regulator n=1 Tax=Halpernia sp. TaxID=2782209 RepID=UPI003A93E0CF